jgi:hypothetical protein
LSDDHGEIRACGSSLVKLDLLFGVAELTTHHVCVGSAV